MAKIVGGVGVSHIPSIGRAIDQGVAHEEPWRSVIEGYEVARKWIADLKPDVMIVVYNDHAAAFSLGVVPSFAIGAAEKYRPIDEGRGRRNVPDFVGDVDLSWHIIDSVIPAGFDLTVCQELEVDHGFSVPMTSLFGQPEEWPVQVIPIAVNVIQQPTPTAARCFALGEAIREAIDSYPGDKRVVVVGTGGMSHQLQGERAGLINQEFDQWFLEMLPSQPEKLASLTPAQYIDQAGSEGSELIMWMVMRGTLGEGVEKIFSDYQAPVSNSAAGLITLYPGKTA